MKYSYFPGCSLERNAAAYFKSASAVTQPFGLQFVEIEDWNCCGATEYIALNLTAAYALVARNLAQAAKLVASPKNGDGNGKLNELVCPCSMCYLNLNKADNYLKETPKLAIKVNAALAEAGLSYKAGTIKVRHLFDVIVNDVGYEAIASKVTRPLKGLKVAPYYGCLIGRPEFTSIDDPEYPTTLDELLKTLGAEVVDYPMKAHCCGGHMTQISEATAFDMIRRLVKGAADYQADMIATVCPMCQLNLDAFQGPMNRYFKTDYHVPVLYYTQLMGMAMGMDAATLGIGAELVDARPALAKVGVEVPPAEPEAPKKVVRKRDDKSLPMPPKLEKRRTAR